MNVITLPDRRMKCCRLTKDEVLAALVLYLETHHKDDVPFMHEGIHVRHSNNPSAPNDGSADVIFELP